MNVYDSVQLNIFFWYNSKRVTVTKLRSPVLTCSPTPIRNFIVQILGNKICR